MLISAKAHYLIPDVLLKRTNLCKSICVWMVGSLKVSLLAFVYLKRSRGSEGGTKGLLWCSALDRIVNEPHTDTQNKICISHAVFSMIKAYWFELFGAFFSPPQKNLPGHLQMSRLLNPFMSLCWKCCFPTQITTTAPKIYNNKKKSCWKVFPLFKEASLIEGEKGSENRLQTSCWLCTRVALSK